MQLLWTQIEKKNTNIIFMTSFSNDKKNLKNSKKSKIL